MSIAFELSSQHQGRQVLAAARKQFPGARTERAGERSLLLDTFDWRLWSAGARLTAAPASRGWTLHWRRTQGEAERAKAVHSLPAFAWDLAPGRLRTEVEGLAEMRRLLPLVELERCWEGIRLLDRRDKTVARLRLEGWRARKPGAKAAKRLPPRLVAVPVRGFDREFQRLLGFLDGRGLERDPRPVLERAYEACGLEPGDYRSKVRVAVEPELPAHLALRRICRQLLEVVRHNEEGLRADLDSEFLHDFRVAVRRTRSALGQVKGVLPARPVRRFRREFSWLGGRTGALRDLDVYLLKLDDYRASLPAEAAAGLGALEELLRRKQKAEHRRVVRTLDSKRYRRLLREWEAFLEAEDAPATPPAGLAPIAEVARDRILKAHVRVIKKGRAIGPDSPDEKLHRLRIDCKKLRYLLELFGDLYEPRKLGRVINALKGLQNNLGDFNDLTVQQGAMTQFAEELAALHAPAAPLLALGQLIADLRGRHDEERRRFHQRFARFDRPGVRRRLVRLVESAVP